MNTGQNPLLQTDVLLLIAEYFSPKEAVAPGLTCYAWSKIFSERIWRECDITQGKQRPGPEVLNRNAHYIKRLVCTGASFLEYLEIPCTQLTALDVKDFPAPSSPDMWSRLAQLVSQNNLLKEIGLCGNDEAATIEFWESLVSRPVLYSVRIDKVPLDEYELVTLWNGCRDVQEIELHGVQVPFSPEIVQERLNTLPNLETLFIDHMSAAVLLTLCPDLMALLWGSNDDPSDVVLDTLTTLIRGQRLRRFESLYLTKAEDSQLASCLDAMDRVKDLSILYGRIGQHTFRALNRHFSTLDFVTLPLECNVTSDKILTILESSPQLTFVSLPIIAASDIIDGKSWVCLKLKKLFVGITVDASEEGATRKQSRAVFERLSKLTSLTYLDIGFHWAGADDNNASHRTQGLDLTMQSGMGELKTLTKMEYLDFSLTIQDMSAEDIAWMSDNWKRLEVVKGVCNQHGTYENQPGISVSG